MAYLIIFDGEPLPGHCRSRISFINHRRLRRINSNVTVGVAMLLKYFKDFDKKLIKKKAADEEAPVKGKGSSKGAIDLRHLQESLSRIIPSHLKVGPVKPIDSAGFSPDGADLVIYNEYCPDIVNIMGGYVPCELLYGLIHVVQTLNKDSLVEAMGKIATAKKLNTFAAGSEEDEAMHIPSFVIVSSTKYEFQELKNDIINYYLSKNIEYKYELDILMVLHKGIVVKNWREKRSFIALETNEDTFMWFFILMNEYLDMKKDRAIDFRNYVKKEVIYNEF